MKIEHWARAIAWSVASVLCIIVNQHQSGNTKNAKWKGIGSYHDTRLITVEANPFNLLHLPAISSILMCSPGDTNVSAVTLLCVLSSLSGLVVYCLFNSFFSLKNIIKTQIHFYSRSVSPLRSITSQSWAAKTRCIMTHPHKSHLTNSLWKSWLVMPDDEPRLARSFASHLPWCTWTVIALPCHLQWCLVLVVSTHKQQVKQNMNSPIIM